MFNAGWCRGVINKRVGRVKRAVKWAASEYLISGAAYLWTTNSWPPGLLKGLALVLVDQ